MAGTSFYNPYANTSKGAGGAGASAPSSVQTPTGRTGFGYLTNDQTGTGQWGTGESFEGAGRQAVLGALQGSTSNENPLDAGANDQMRSYLTNYLADLPGQGSDHISSFDTQAQRGLSNLLSQHAASAAGTGTMGSRQYGGAAGDITSRAGSDYMNGLIQARANSLNQALGVQSGLNGVEGQNLRERQFQLDQGKTLAGGYMGLMSLDSGRQAQLEQERFQADQENKKMMAQLAGDAVQGGAMVATGGASAAIPAASGASGAASAGASGNFAADGGGIPYNSNNYAQNLYYGNYGSGGF